MTEDQARNLKIGDTIWRGADGCLGRIHAVDREMKIVWEDGMTQYVNTAHLDICCWDWETRSSDTPSAKDQVELTLLSINVVLRLAVVMLETEPQPAVFTPADVSSFITRLADHIDRIIECRQGAK